MHDTNKTRREMRKHLLQLGDALGPGSWEEQVESEVTPDGRTELILVARPAKKTGRGEVALAKAETPASTQGRTGEVARVILTYLLSHPESRHADILDAMAREGHSATAINDNLKVLRQLGLVAQAQRGGPYSAALGLSGDEN
jgi:hypothetical protein